MKSAMTHIKVVSVEIAPKMGIWIATSKDLLAEKMGLLVAHPDKPKLLSLIPEGIKLLYQQKYGIEVVVYDVDVSDTILRNGASGSFLLGIVPADIDHLREEATDAHAIV